MTYSSIQRVVDIFDRHPQRVGLFTNQYGIGAHAAVERFTYTIPAGRNAIIERVYLRQQRIALGTTPGLTDNSLYVGGNVALITLLTWPTFTAAGQAPFGGIQYVDMVVLTNLGIMVTGEIIKNVTTGGGSVDSTVFYYTNVGLILFDA